MGIRQRIKRLESKLHKSPVAWFSLATWLQEWRDKVILDEQEQRRLAEHPEHEAEIRQQFVKIRKRLLEVELL